MGLVIPQVVTEDRASGAQVIDGSLKFDGSYLKRTPGSAGNRKIFTWSGWVKLNELASFYLFSVPDSGGHASFMFDSGQLRWNTYSTSTNGLFTSNAYFRDTGWYHVVFAFDATESTTTDRIKVYVNGERLTSSSYTTPDGSDTPVNNTVEHSIGARYQGATSGDVNITNNYFIDGQALDASYFGYTDPLTNTWRPKKYTGAFTGTNTFYLPFDGNSPIGEDKSGQGNNWTPKNFGGSVALPKATGAKPILNTDGGGNVARPGVFGSELNQTIAVTVSNASGNNKFYLDGSLTPNLAFTRGSTITFNTGDSTGNGHPFKLSSTNASGSGGTEYTDGVAYYINGSVVSGSDYVTNYSSGAASGFRGIKWTVPHNQSTTYYYCTIHTGMGNNGAFTSTIDETKADPYAWKCVLATPLVGDIDDVSADINATTTKKAATNYGSTDSSAVSNFYGRSRKFDGSNDNINYAASADLGFDGDFTIECFCTPGTTGNDSNAIIASKGYYNTGNNWYLKFNDQSSGHMQWYSYVGTSSGENLNVTNLGTTDANRIYHIAVTRESNVMRFYLDGVKVGNATFSRNYSDGANNGLTFARQPSGNSANSAHGWYDGYISDLRIYKGVAKYTGATTGVQYFVPPSTSPDILPDTPSGVSGSSKLTKIPDSITEGAVTFDGTGDYLLVEHSDMAMGTGDFTVEFSVYNTINKNYNAFISTRETSNGTSAGFVIASNASGDLYVHSAAAVAGSYSGGAILPLNRWCHVAYTRSGGTHRLFLNGVATNNSTTTVRDYTEDMLVIGDNGYAKDEPIKGFISNVRVIKGTALYTSNFTPPTSPLTNVTNTKLLCCQSNTSAIAAAVTPVTITAGGNAVASTFSPFNTDINTVRGQETGYCTWNPLSNYGLTLANGNLDWQGGTNQRYCRPTLFADSGKWYCEFHMRSTSHIPGIIREDHKDAAGILGELASSRFQNNGTIGYSGGDSVTGGTTWGVDDCVQLFMDMDNKSIYWGVNGIMKIGDDGLSGNPLSGSNHTGAVIYPGVDGLTDRISEKAWGPAAGTPSANSTSVYSSVNFGQKPFKYAPPEGYQPWNAANIRPDTVIARPDHYVKTVLWTGNGGTQDINTGLKPDLVWLKSRNQSYNHYLIDTIRGAGKVLHSNHVDAQINQSDTLTSFNSDGFSLDSRTGVNSNNNTFVAWSWRAGGNKNTFNVDDVGYASAAAAGLDGGSLNPTAASVGTRQGFSILKYTGAGAAKTINHGLNQAPEFILVKRLEVNASWAGYHVGAGNTKVFELNGSGSPNTSSSVWNSTTPTSSVWSIGNYADTGDSGGDYVAYLWHSVPGLQKIGSFVGNGSADGVFVETGFKVAWLLTKSTSNSRSWNIWDTARDTYNPNDANLFPHNNNAESSDPLHNVDMLSNGFKCRTGNVDRNGSGETYIYMAWAEAPTVNLFGAQSNAR